MNKQNHALGILNILALSVTALVLVLFINLFSIFYRNLHEPNASSNNAVSGLYVSADNFPPRVN